MNLQSLAKEIRWVAWLEELTKKVPKNPRNGRNAEVPTNPKTYGTRAAAISRAQKIKGGYGIVLGKLPNGQHLAGIDLDSCRDAESGAIAHWAKDVIDRFDTYTEISPSGSGTKLFFLMNAADKTKLQNLLGRSIEGNQLTRKTFAAGKHREVAIDTARFYAVTNQHLKSSRKNFRLVPFADVEWFVMQAGPAYLAQQGNGHANSFEAFGNEHQAEIDESGSGYGFRFMANCHTQGMSEEQAHAAILADQNEAGEWANRVDARQLKRAWANSQPAEPSTVEPIDLWENSSRCRCRASCCPDRSRISPSRSVTRWAPIQPELPWRLWRCVPPPPPIASP